MKKTILIIFMVVLLSSFVSAYCNETTIYNYDNYSIQAGNASYLIANTTTTNVCADEYDIKYLGVGFCLLFTGFIFLFFAFQLDEEHFLLKLFLIFFFIASAIATPTVIVKQTYDYAYKIPQFFFRVFVTYFLIYIIWHWFRKSETFAKMLVKLGIRKNNDEEQ